jgi:hypothetical protein
MIKIIPEKSINNYGQCGSIPIKRRNRPGSGALKVLYMSPVPPAGLAGITRERDLA